MSDKPKGHGHVTPNANGDKARCGGPKICKVCMQELAELKDQPSGVVLSQASLTAAVDAAMVEMQNISPPIGRGECARLIRAAFARLNQPASAGDEQKAGTKVSDTSINCWSCKLSVSLDERADADGNCPHCRVELDLEEYLRSALSANHSEQVRGMVGGWIKCSERMPECGTPVQAYYLNSHGKGRTIRAHHIKAWTVEVEPDDPDVECVEYSEQQEAYYLLEGWYELMDNWEQYSSIAVTEGVITQWAPLLPAPEASGQ